MADTGPRGRQRVVLGRDPLPEWVRENIAKALAIVRVQEDLVLTGRLTTAELDDYDWSVKERRVGGRLVQISVIYRRIGVPPPTYGRETCTHPD